MRSIWKRFLVSGTSLLVLTGLGFGVSNNGVNAKHYHSHIRYVRRGHRKSIKRHVNRGRRKPIKRWNRIHRRKLVKKSRKVVQHTYKQKSIMHSGDVITKGVWGANSKSGLHYEADNHGDVEITSGGNNRRDNYDYSDNMPQSVNNAKHIQVDNGVGRGIKNMFDMFSQGPNKLESISLPSGFGSNAKDVSGMFQGLTNLKYANLPAGFGKRATDMGALFAENSSLSHLKVSPKFTTKHVDGEDDGFDGIFATGWDDGFSGKSVPKSAWRAIEPHIPRKYWNSLW